MFVLRLFITVIFTLFVRAVLASSSDIKPSTQACEDIIGQNKYEYIVLACMDTHGNESWEQALITRDFSSYLGNLEKLSRAGLLLQSKAESGDVDAQYAFAINTTLMNPEPNNPSRWFALVDKHRQKWLLKASEQGHAMAMKSYIDHLIIETDLLSEQEHDRGKAFAKHLVSETGFGGENYLYFFNNMPHQKNWKQFIQAKLDKLSTLPTEEIREISFGFLSGYYKFISPVKSPFLDNSGFRQQEIRSVANRIKFFELTYYLADVRADPEAAYRLAREHFFGTNRNITKAFAYFESAVDGGYPKALTFLGRYLVCAKHTQPGRSFLVQAKNAGNTNAIDELDDLDKNGDLYGCPDIPLNITFIKKYTRT